MLVLTTSKEEWCDWDDLVTIFSNSIWIWQADSQRQLKHLTLECSRLVLRFVSSFSKRTVWERHCHLLKFIKDCFEMDWLSIPFQIQLLVTLASNGKVLDDKVIDFLLGPYKYLWSHTSDFVDYFDTLIDNFFNSEVGTSSGRLSIIKTYGDLRSVQYANHSKNDPRFSKMVSRLILEKDSIVFQAVITWIIKDIGYLTDEELGMALDVLLQITCSTLPKSRAVEFKSFWKTFEKNTNIPHPSSISGYERLDVSEEQCQLATKGLISLFHYSSQIERTQVSVETFAWLCRITSWNCAVLPSARTLALEFLCSFSCNSISEISYTFDSKKYIAFQTTNLTSNDRGKLFLPSNEFLYSSMAILQFEPHYSFFENTILCLERWLVDRPFWSCFPKELQMLCDQIIYMLINEFNFSCIIDIPSSVKKHDLYLKLYQILSKLFIYKSILTKQQQDSIIPALMFGLRWPPIARYCVYCLSLALYELPNSIKRHLHSILMKLSQSTSSNLAIPNLEFLAALASLPSLHVNLSFEDYKRIFGAALTYLRQKSGSGAQHTTFAYHVTQVWFLSLRLQERSKYVPMIVSILLANSEKSSSSELDESVELVLDMMAQHTFVDCSPKPLVQKWTRPDNPGKTWSQGNSLITIHVNSGSCQIVIRRPVGVTVLETNVLNEIGRLNLSHFEKNPLDLKPALSKTRLRSVSDGSIDQFEISSIPQTIFNRPRSLSIGIEAVVPTQTSVDDPFLQAIDPTFLLLQFQPYPSLSGAQEVPRLMASDEAGIRAIAVLDRTPSIDLHKIGIVYVAPGQKNETEILANTYGSPAYSHFLSTLGHLVPLANNRDIYTGGLDTSPECFDGKFGLLFIPDQRLTQMIFHVTTMMPTQSHDPSSTAKKRHIGNDYVMIVWNEAGFEFNRETIPGQFNLIQIVIEPLLGKFEVVSNDSLFKVSVGFRNDMPSSALPTQILSGSSLGPYVRQISIYCNIIAQVFTSGEASSNAKERLRQIKRIKGRLEPLQIISQPLDFTFLY